MRKYYLVILIFINFSAFGQSNYFDYHRKIIIIEQELLANNFKDAFSDYTKLFNEFDFVFPRDCLVASQFAYFNNDKEKALTFIKKGFLMGLMPYHILQCPIFKKNENDKVFFDSVFKIFRQVRPLLLKKIDTTILKEVLDIKWYDQLYKNINPTFSISSKSKVLLDTIGTSNLKRTIEIIKKVGFPGQKIIGVVHNYYFKELGIKGQLSPLDRYNQFSFKKEHILNERQFDLNRGLEFLSNDVALIALYHQPCAFMQIGEKILFDCIKNGTLYPNDYALLYQSQQIRGFAQFSKLDKEQFYSICPIKEPFNGGYGIAIAYDNADTVRINQNRKSIGMRSLEHSKKMYLFAREKGIVVRFGYMEWK